MSADTNTSKPEQADSAKAEALRSVRVEMVAVPNKPEPLAHPLLPKIAEWLGGSRLWAKGIFLLRGTEVVTVLNEALRREEQRLLLLEAFETKIYRNIGEAWKEAGQPRLAGLASVPAADDPKEIEKETAAIARLDEQHSSNSRMFAKRRESMDAEMARREERLQQSNNAVGMLDSAATKLAMEGSLALTQVLEELPSDLRRTLQRASFAEVRDDLDGLREKLNQNIVQMQEGLTQAAKDRELHTEEAVRAEVEINAMRSELNRRQIDRERGLDDSLGQIGRELEGRLSLFENGEYLANAVRDGKQLLVVTKNRLEGLNRAFKTVNDLTGGLVLNRGILIGGMAVICLGVLFLGVRTSIEMGVWESHKGIGGLHTWELPDTVEIYGEIQLEEVQSYVPLIRTVNRLRKAITTHPSANLFWESKTQFDRSTVLGFAGVLSDRSMVTIGPFADQEEKIEKFWSDRGVKPSDREEFGETIKRLDYLRGYFVDDDGRLLQGDPDLLSDIMATRSRELDSLEHTDSFDFLSSRIAGVGCAWFVLNKTEKIRWVATLLSPFGLSQMPASIGVEIYCTRPFRARLLLQFDGGGGIQAGSELNQAFSGDAGAGSVAVVRKASIGTKIRSDGDVVVLELDLKNEDLPSVMRSLF